MKYMGSKRAMLRNGLGEILQDQIPRCSRFVDLFAGSSAVARHVAENFPVSVIASDLQTYSAVLADAVLLRTHEENGTWIEGWMESANAALLRHSAYPSFASLSQGIGKTSVDKLAANAREMCSDRTEPIVQAYGGYYFSPLQCLMLHSLREALPSKKATSRIGLAAMIEAASVCAAAPGHTAQPFKPNDTAGKFLVEAWSKDLWGIVRKKAETISATYALKKGKSIIGDANKIAQTLQQGDLVFVDPPYSAVHYSRFYHVLETIASGSKVEVSGEGRYPPPEERPRSDYSIGSKSSEAMCDLLEKLSVRGCRVIITFPANAASNGLSGETVQEIAAEYFEVESATIHGRFSTLGGNKKHRTARQKSEELVLSLAPR